MEPQFDFKTIESIYQILPQVLFDDNGTFKYILVAIYKKKSEGEKYKKPLLYFIRGYARCNYHMDIFDDFNEEVRNSTKVSEFLKSLNSSKENISFFDIFGVECEGGGRIAHDRNGKSIKIYGYSQGYGPADHFLSAQIIKGCFKDYPSELITWSSEGY